MDVKEYSREAVAIAMIVLAVVVLISLVTYSPSDYTDDQYSGNDQPVKLQNKCGIVGKVLSRFLFRSIGVAGYVLVFFVFMWGTILAFARNKAQHFWYRFIASLLLVFACALFASLNSFSAMSTGETTDDVIYPVLEPMLKNSLNLGDVGFGGNFGYVAARAARKLIGRVGSEILAVGMILITLEFSFGFLFSTLAGRTIAWSKRLRAALKARREKQAAVKRGEDGLQEPKLKVKKTPGTEDAKPDENKPEPGKPAPSVNEDAPKEKSRIRDLFGGGKKDKDKDKDKGREKPKPEPKKDKKPVEIPQDGDYVLPPIDILEDIRKVTRDRTEVQEKRARVIEEILANFKIEGKVVAINPGPVITQYEIELGAGIRVNAVLQLSDNLSMALQSPGIRIEAPIPGKSTVGIEVPNKESEFVQMKDLMLNRSEKGKKAGIPLLIGKDTRGRPIESDLSAMPHLLIAGSTGSGKTVCINSMIISILMLRKPEEVKMIIVDPKMVDMAAYKEIPHLLTPVVTDTQKAEAVLNWAVSEMERRYKLFSLTGARNLASYNKLKKTDIDKSLEDAGNPNIYAQAETPYPMPYLVIVVDELADLMFASPKEIEYTITRIAQKARAAGIHLVLSTQRPSVDVITGLIKSNIPCRIAFQVAAKVDSRTILDMNGAEALLGHGDMLYLPPGVAKAMRGQGVYISDQEITDIVNFCKGQSKPFYSTSLKRVQEGGPQGDLGNDIDEGLDDAIKVILDSQRGSASLLQRKLGFGYNRATKVLETMEILGVVGPYVGSKARDVIITIEEYEEMGGVQGLVARYEQQKSGD